MILALLGSLGPPWDLLGGVLGLSCSSLGAPWVPPGALLAPFGLTWEPLGPQGGPVRTPGLTFYRFVCAFLMLCDDCWLLCVFVLGGCWSGGCQ